MQASGILVSGAPHTSKRTVNKLCPESDKLLRKWIVDILFRPTKPSISERKEILEEIRKRDPWYNLQLINGFIQRWWDRLHPPSIPCKNQENATEWPSVNANLSVDVTKTFRTLLCERTDASYEAIITWAVSLGIEEDVAKGYVKRLRRAHETVNERGSSMDGGHLDKLDLTKTTQGADASNGFSIPSNSPSRDSGSPQLELLVSTVDPQHRHSSPINLSPRSVLYQSRASSPRVGPVEKAECAEECPVAPNSESDSKRLASQEEEEEEEEECPVAFNSESDSKLLNLRSDLSVDVTKTFRTLVSERTDTSYEAIITWAVSLGIEEDIAKGYVKQLRRGHEKANERGSSWDGGHLDKLDLTQTTQGADASNGFSIPSHSPSRESGSPQLELLVSTVDPQHRDSLPIDLSPPSVSYASRASSPRVGPVEKAECAEECPVAPNSESDSKHLASPEEEEEECPVASNSESDSKPQALPEEEEEEEEEEEDCTVHGHDNDNVVAGVIPTHSSPSTSPLPMGAEGFNHRSRPASPSGTSHDISQIAASLNVPTMQDDMLIDTPAQALAPNMSLGDNSCQMNTFPSLAMSAMDSVDFAMVDRFEGSAPIHNVTPDENVPRLPSFAESSKTQEKVDSPTSSKGLATKFKPYRDQMDSLILRVRSARRAQEKRRNSPYPQAGIPPNFPICNRCRSGQCCANLPTPI